MARRALWSAALLRRFGSFITEDGKEHGADQDRTECTRLAKSIVPNLLIQLKTSAPQLIRWIGFSEDGVS
jgi:hypothetical protein